MEIDNPPSERSPLIQSSNPISTTTTTPAPTLSTSALYTSHFLSTFNSRVFEYAAVLFLAELIPDTLAPSSWYALGRSLAVIVASRRIGRYIDVSPRLPTVRKSIVFQRLAVVLSCIILGIMALIKSSPSAPGWAFQSQDLFDSTSDKRGLWFDLSTELLILLIPLAGIEKLAAMMNTIVVERDWVVVVAGGNSRQLARLNSQMRRIDLFCKMCGPLAIASLISVMGMEVALVVILVTNLVSVGVEYWAIARVYYQVPALAIKAAPSHDHIADESSSSSSRVSSLNSTSRLFGWLKPFHSYAHHAMFIPSLTLSLLYFTVLSFGGQMIVFLLFADMDPAHVTWLRTSAVIFELSATFLAPWLIKRIGAPLAGLWLINWQALCIIFAVLSFSFPQITRVNVGLWGLVVGVILSRLGLWGFDLAAQVQIQEGVEESKRAIFSSTESAIQSIFDLLSFVATIVWAKPEQFKYPAWASAAAVCMAAGLYSLYVLKGKVSGR